MFYQKNRGWPKYFWGGKEAAHGRSPPAEIGELPRPRKQRVSTVQPIAGRLTGCDALIYCLNRRHDRMFAGVCETGARVETCG